ncbi:heterokaryon incompatibility protein-domain-containing protein [Immersiella caudata]|uniref:Heterokaryon incompatibility protein-domain-containing protein n=1 Tax=Immersiella caudata TaxID=314043 RepID=A0AA40BXW1_9PEZI|nr:heterokaryon incompatibility protein-domain-containing protein [Immersiella caudata]
MELQTYASSNGGTTEAMQPDSLRRQALADQQVRLLDLLPGEGDAMIECNVRVVSLVEEHPYEALSYVWGDPSDCISIQVQHRDIKITRNLHAALHRLRSATTTRTLWVDQLCINQWDNDEKTEQVRLMRQIYQRCTQCLIWLGEIHTAKEAAGDRFTLSDARTALVFLQQLADLNVRPIKGMPTFFSESASGIAARRAFNAMFMHGNAWWSRIWTVQEAILPPSALLLWGPLLIPWSTVRQVADNLTSGSDGRRNIHPAVRSVFARHSTLIDSFLYPVRGLAITHKGEPPLRALHRWRYRSASDPRDKLFALMGLFLEPIPDVSGCRYNTPPAELFRVMTVGLIRLERTLRPLIGFRGEPHVTPDLPSWALDLVPYDYGISGERPWSWWSHGLRYGKFTACGQHNLPNFDGERSSGIMVDEVAEVGEVLGREAWDDLSDEMIIRTIRSWEALLRRVGLGWKNSCEPEDSYIGGGTIDDAFWRTMIGNLVLYRYPTTIAAEADRSAYDAFLERGERNQVYGSLRDMVVNQAFFVTRKGYMGLGPPNTSKWDEIWILSGGNVPFVLRERRSGRWGDPVIWENRRFFIGDAYVHGVMQGEAAPDRMYFVELV